LTLCKDSVRLIPVHRLTPEVLCTLVLSTTQGQLAMKLIASFESAIDLTTWLDVTFVSVGIKPTELSSLGLLKLLCVWREGGGC
jgi:hypothetical protein